MAVQKAVDLIGTGHTVEDAVAEAVDRAGLTLEGISSFEVRKLRGSVEGARITYEVRIRVWFTLLERMRKSQSTRLRSLGTRPTRDILTTLTLDDLLEAIRD